MFSITPVLLSKALHKYLGFRIHVVLKSVLQKLQLKTRKQLFINYSWCYHFLFFNCNFFLHLLCHENSEYRNTENNFKYLKCKTHIGKFVKEDLIACIDITIIQMHLSNKSHTFKWSYLLVHYYCHCHNKTFKCTEISSLTASTLICWDEKRGICHALK